MLVLTTEAGAPPSARSLRLRGNTYSAFLSNTKADWRVVSSQPLFHQWVGGGYFGLALCRSSQTHPGSSLIHRSNPSGIEGCTRRNQGGGNCRFVRGTGVDGNPG